MQISDFIVGALIGAVAIYTAVLFVRLILD